MLGVAVIIVVVDGCYHVYKKRKMRKEVERQLGITPEVRREMRRMQREQKRQQREREKNWRRRLREQERARANGTWDGVEVGAPPDEFSELAGLGLPEYSLRPRDGVDRAVTIQGEEGLTMNGRKKKGIRNLFKGRRSDPEPIVEGEVQRLQKKKKGWLRKKKGRRAEEQSRAILVEGPPPPYEVITDEIEESSVIGTSAVPRRNSV